jgi:hypothetical protein
LNSFDQKYSESCPGGGDRIVNGTVQSSEGFIALQNITVCTAGQNEVIYDIGTLNDIGEFVPSALAVYSVEMTVLTGSAVVFRLILRNATTQHTYSRISSAVGVILQDQGRNVISSLSFVLTTNYAIDCFDPFF